MPLTKMRSVEGKVVVLGAQGVGKTSVITRYIHKSYNSYVSPTIGASFFTCKCQIDDVHAKLQVWDTAGQERFRSMAPMYYRNANAAILIYDITHPGSFENIKYWVRELKGMVDESIYLCVVGNKTDLIQDRKVARDEALQYSKTIGATYFESSALHDQGIQKIFTDIALGLLRLSGEPSAATVHVVEGESPVDGDVHILEDGQTETVNWSIDSIAHGNNVKTHMCC